MIQIICTKKLRALSDDRLLCSIEELVRTERGLLIEILHHMIEIDRRRLYVGYSSLFDYSVRSLGYSESQACRRIAAMRLMREIPEIESKIESGSLSLTNLNMAQELFRQEKNLTTSFPKNKNSSS